VGASPFEVVSSGAMSNLRRAQPRVGDKGAEAPRSTPGPLATGMVNSEQGNRTPGKTCLSLDIGSGRRSLVVPASKGRLKGTFQAEFKLAEEFLWPFGKEVLWC